MERYGVWIIMAMVAVGISAIPATAELVGHWELNETDNSDPLVDSTGNSPDGSIGDPADVTPGAAGIFGTAFDFNGRTSAEDQNNGYATTGSDDVVSASGDFGIFAWINTTSSRHQYIFSNHPGVNVDGRFSFGTTESTGTLEFFLGASSGGGLGVSGVNVVDGSWHHVGLTRDASAANQWTFWIDGAAVQVAGTAGITADVLTGGANIWDIGNRMNGIANNNGDRTWFGRIDDVLVFDSDLTGAQVRDLSLLAHYRLDEKTAGPVIEDTGYNPDGTNVGSTSVNQPGAAGWTDTAYAFDGSNDKIELNTTDLIPTGGDFSVFMWINTTQNTDPAGAYLFTNWVVSQPGRFAIQINDGELGYFVEAESFSTGVDVNDGEWHHIGLGREAGDYVMWLDGVMFDVDDASVDISQTLEFLLGGRIADNARNYAGLMDDVRIYARSLSASEVHSLIVPEPASAVLLMTGSLLVLRRRKR